MRVYTFIIFLLTPLIMLGQDLKCGNAISEIETCLTGDWKLQDESVSNIYSFYFKNGKGQFLIYSQNDDGTLGTLNENTPEIKILKYDTGFKIEFNYDGLKIYSIISFLDPNMLKIKRRDGAERTYHRLTGID